MRKNDKWPVTTQISHRSNSYFVQKFANNLVSKKGKHTLFIYFKSIKFVNIWSW